MFIYKARFPTGVCYTTGFKHYFFSSCLYAVFLKEKIGYVMGLWKAVFTGDEKFILWYVFVSHGIFFSVFVLFISM